MTHSAFSISSSPISRSPAVIATQLQHYMVLNINYSQLIKFSYIQQFRHFSCDKTAMISNLIPRSIKFSNFEKSFWSFVLNYRVNYAVFCHFKFWYFHTYVQAFCADVIFPVWAFLKWFELENLINVFVVSVSLCPRFVCFSTCSFYYLRSVTSSFRSFGKQTFLSRTQVPKTETNCGRQKRKKSSIICRNRFKLNKYIRIIKKSKMYSLIH